MNLRDLAYLVALDETRHFGRAAERVHVSQPTLSGQIRKLEDELGVVLFERDSRHVAPTPAGVAVLSEARGALAHARAIREIAAAHADPLTGVLRLGIIASLAPFLAPEMLGALRAAAPGLTIELIEGLTDGLTRDLGNGAIDAALLATPVEDDRLSDTALFDEPFLIGHAVDDPLAKVAKPGLEDLRACGLLLLGEGHCLRNQALGLCSDEAVDAGVQATSLVTLMRLAAAGRGVTLVPLLASGSAEDLVLRPLDDPRAARRVRLVSRRGYPRTRTLDAVADAVRAVAAGRGLGLR